VFVNDIPCADTVMLLNNVEYTQKKQLINNSEQTYHTIAYI